MTGFQVFFPPAKSGVGRLFIHPRVVFSRSLSHIASAPPPRLVTALPHLGNFAARGNSLVAFSTALGPMLAFQKHCTRSNTDMLKMRAGPSTFVWVSRSSSRRRPSWRTSRSARPGTPPRSPSRGGSRGSVWTNFFSTYDDAGQLVQADYLAACKTLGMLAKTISGEFGQPHSPGRQTAWFCTSSRLRIPRLAWFLPPAARETEGPREPVWRSQS